MNYSRYCSIQCIAQKRHARLKTTEVYIFSSVLRAPYSLHIMFICLSFSHPTRNWASVLCSRIWLQVHAMPDFLCTGSEPYLRWAASCALTIRPTQRSRCGWVGKASHSEMRGRKFKSCSSEFFFFSPVSFYIVYMATVNSSDMNYLWLLMSSLFASRDKGLKKFPNSSRSFLGF